MIKTFFLIKQLLISLGLLFCYSTSFGQTTALPTIDLEKARIIVDSLDKQFAAHYYNGDSLALAAMYTKDASFGCLKGNEILQAMGKMIRNSIKNNTRNITYTTTSLSIDSEYLLEVGRYEIKDDQGNLKENGKYLVVWKQENGAWKLYRDMGL